jgi:hypothetical protein
MEAGGRSRLRSRCRGASVRCSRWRSHSRMVGRGSVEAANRDDMADAVAAGGLNDVLWSRSTCTGAGWRWRGARRRLHRDLTQKVARGYQTDPASRS